MILRLSSWMPRAFTQATCVASCKGSVLTEILCFPTQAQRLLQSRVEQHGRYLTALMQGARRRRGSGSPTSRPASATGGQLAGAIGQAAATPTSPVLQGAVAPHSGTPTAADPPAMASSGGEAKQTQPKTGPLSRPGGGSGSAPSSEGGLSSFQQTHLSPDLGGWLQLGDADGSGGSAGGGGDQVQPLPASFDDLISGEPNGYHGDSLPNARMLRISSILTAADGDDGGDGFHCGPPLSDVRPAAQPAKGMHRIWLPSAEDLPGPVPAELRVGGSSISPPLAAGSVLHSPPEHCGSARAASSPSDAEEKAERLMHMKVESAVCKGV